MDTVLFVCVENTFRSILSERIFNSRAPAGWRAESAGVSPARAVNPAVRGLLSGISIPFAERVPRGVTPQLVAGSTYVVTFGCLDRCPAGTEQKAEDWPIPGATNKSEDELRQIRDELSRRIDDLIRRRCLPNKVDGETTEQKAPTPEGIKELRKELVRAARARGTLTYGQLMKMLGVSRGRPLFDAISGVDRDEYAKGAPGFAAIIVRKDTGYPGGGFFCDDDLPPALRRPYERASDPRLSAAEMNYVKEVQKSIWDYYSRDLTP